MYTHVSDNTKYIYIYIYIYDISLVLLDLPDRIEEFAIC